MLGEEEVVRVVFVVGIVEPLVVVVVGIVGALVETVVDIVGALVVVVVDIAPQSDTLLSNSNCFSIVSYYYWWF